MFSSACIHLVALSLLIFTQIPFSRFSSNLRGAAILVRSLPTKSRKRLTITQSPEGNGFEDHRGQSFWFRSLPMKNRKRLTITQRPQGNKFEDFRGQTFWFRSLTMKSKKDWQSHNAFRATNLKISQGSYFGFARYRWRTEKKGLTITQRPQSRRMVNSSNGLKRGGHVKGYWVNYSKV